MASTHVARSTGRYTFKRASATDELEQLHRLNFRTFVRELPQHADPGQGRLVDKLHDRNTYFVALDETHVVGMIAVHDLPPFSIQDKLPAGFDPARLGTRPLEVRLLAIDAAHRGTRVLAGLCHTVLQHARARGYSHLLISGVVGQQRMYRSMGFTPLGPSVTSGEVDFVPMAACVDALPGHIDAAARRFQRRLRFDARGDESERGAAEHGVDAHAGDRGADDHVDERGVADRRDADHGVAERVVAERGVAERGVANRAGDRGQAPPQALLSLTPGMAALSAHVARAARRAPVDHRSETFAAVWRRVRRRLSRLVGDRDTALFCGGGTLANDVVAHTLAADRSVTPGLVLVNGEFGRRLTLHAQRAGLAHRVLAWEWGRPWELADVAAALTTSRIDWVWAVHLESSTGMLNDVAALSALANAHGARLCVDAVSSLGAVPLDLPGAHLVAGSSAKALGGVAGVGMVFATRDALPAVDDRRIPPPLDLLAALDHGGPRFTVPSAPLLALDAALDAYDTTGACARRFAEYERLGHRVRHGLARHGLAPLVGEAGAAFHPSPVITTFPGPASLTNGAVLARLEARGVRLGGGSGYLRQRGWLQIATLGAVTERDVDDVLGWLGDAARS